MPSASQQPKEKQDPYASVNKLAVYAQASAVKRESLLRRWKYPGGIPAHWYKQARDAIAQSIQSGDYSNLATKAASLEKDSEDKALTDQQRKLRGASSEAITSFINSIGDLPDLSGWTKSTFPVGHTFPKVNICGVDISVAPEILLEKNETVGAIKLHISKSAPLDDKTGHLSALLVKSFLDQEHGGSGKSVDTSHVWIVDVLEQDVWGCPASSKNRLREIQACCREISSRWPTITRS